MSLNLNLNATLVGSSSHFTAPHHNHNTLDSPAERPHIAISYLPGTVVAFVCDPGFCTLLYSALPFSLHTHFLRTPFSAHPFSSCTPCLRALSACYQSRLRTTMPYPSAFNDNAHRKPHSLFSAMASLPPVIPRDNAKMGFPWAGITELRIRMRTSVFANSC
jgi:hypothetical protein